MIDKGGNKYKGGLFPNKKPIYNKLLCNESVPLHKDIGQDPRLYFQQGMPKGINTPQVRSYSALTEARMR